MCGVRFQTLDARHDWAITPSRVWTLDHIWRNYRHLGSPYKIHSDQGIWALSTKAAVFTYYLSHPAISNVVWAILLYVPLDLEQQKYTFLVLQVQVFKTKYATYI